DCRQRVSKRSQPIPEQCPKLLDHFRVPGQRVKSEEQGAGSREQGARQKAKGKRQKAKGKRQKAKGKRQKAAPAGRAN
ncbi:hypothetical protein, partial [Burkholderia pseudomallei]|uniref:hypothetical protein n=1 Tax=Burkholderia pseudomallei TaxID=28450 RepID=UPI0028800D6D